VNDSDERIVDADLLQRVYGEYIEMPGLQLTVAQASRLWNVERESAARTLDLLVKTSFLRRRDECYVRADCGRICA
jgi:hypothetical protein